MFQNYANFGNKTILNYEDNNNSINPWFGFYLKLNILISFLHFFI